MTAVFSLKSFCILLNASNLELFMELHLDMNLIKFSLIFNDVIHLVLHCICVRTAPTSALTANSGANWLRYGAVRAANTEDGKTSVEFEPSSHSTRVRRSGRSPSLVLALLKTFIRYFVCSGALLFGFDLIIFINPFLLK